MKRPEYLVIALVIAVVFGGGGFAIGRLTVKKTSTVAESDGSGLDSQAGGGFGGRRLGARPTFGTVSSVSGNTITITDQAGTTHTVNVTSTTTYSSGAGATASQSDIQSGATIAAIGQTATDGSLAATRIIINPQQPTGVSGGSAATEPVN